jgi:hypothetical protein
MEVRRSGKTADATQQEARAATTVHPGPTADRYGSALVRYVEAVFGDRPPVTGEVTPTYLTFPPLTVSDVMTRAVVSAYEGAVFKEIAAALDRNGINAVPVIDAEHKVVGVVSTSDLLARVGHVRPAIGHGGTVAKRRSGPGRAGAPLALGYPGQYLVDMPTAPGPSRLAAGGATSR